MIIAIVDDGTESIIDIDQEANWISGGEDCSTIKAFINPEDKASNPTLVITGGHNPLTGTLKSSEVFEISESSVKTCQHSFDLPAPLESAAGNVLTKYIGVPIICGGANSLAVVQDDCYMLGNKSAEPFGPLSAARNELASVLMPGGKTIWVTGGRDYLGSAMFTATDYISWETSSPIVSPGPDLPFRITGHCMINLDDKAVLLIGGIKVSDFNGEEYTSDQTWLFNLTSENWIRTEVALKHARANLVCGLIKESDPQSEFDRFYLLLVGGLITPSAGVTDTIEQMEISLQGDVVTDLNANIWTVSQQKLPKERAHMASTTTPDKKTLIVAGGWPVSTDILWFQCLKGKCEYDNNLILKLQTPRWRAVATILTDTDLICED